MLTRSKFCEILGIDTETLKSRARRGQLPFVDDDRRRGEYTPYEAFLTHVVQNLASSPLNIPLSAAAKIVSHAAQPMMHRIDDIGATGFSLATGRTVPEILMSVVWRPGLRADEEKAYIGSLQEVTLGIEADHEPIVWQISISLSRCAATFERLAWRYGVDLRPFWGREA